MDSTMFLDVCIGCVRLTPNTIFYHPLHAGEIDSHQIFLQHERFQCWHAWHHATRAALCSVMRRGHLIRLVALFSQHNAGSGQFTWITSEEDSIHAAALCLWQK